MIDAHLTFKEYIAQLRQRLRRINGLLAKLSHQVSSSLLKTIYFVVFDSHLRYAAQVWSQGRNNAVNMIKRTHSKALRIIIFKDRTESLDQPQNFEITKYQYIEQLFIYNQLCDNLPNTFSSYFKLLKNQHKHNTRVPNHFTLNVPRANTEKYGLNSIKIKVIKD